MVHENRKEVIRYRTLPSESLPDKASGESPIQKAEDSSIQKTVKMKVKSQKKNTI